VRILIRRPHACRFLADHPEIGELSPETAAKTRPTGELTAEGQPIYVLDGSSVPIPGVALLGADGRVRAFVKLGGKSARDALVAALRAPPP
jgi:hypothetical protein